MDLSDLKHDPATTTIIGIELITKQKQGFLNELRALFGKCSDPEHLFWIKLLEMSHSVSLRLHNNFLGSEFLEYVQGKFSADIDALIFYNYE